MTTTIKTEDLRCHTELWDKLPLVVLASNSLLTAWEDEAGQRAWRHGQSSWLLPSQWSGK